MPDSITGFARRVSAPMLVVVFVLQTTAFLPLWPKDRKTSIFTPDVLDPSGTQGINTVLFIASSTATLVVLFVALRRHSLGKSIVELLISNWILVLVVVWAASSAVWAGTPIVSIRKAIGLALTIALVIVARCVFTARRLLLLVHIGLLIAALCSLAAAVFWPAYATLATNTSHRIWQGVFTSKNVLAMHSGLLASSSFGLFIVGGRVARVSATASFGLAIFLMVRAESAGAFVALAVSLAVGGLCSVEAIKGRVSPKLRSISAVAGVSAVAIFWLSGVSGAGALGKNSNLTGRTDLWVPLVDAIGQRWLFGYGYHSFWIGSGRVATVYRDSGVRLGSAHNGYLDVALSLGLVGLALGVALLVQGFRQSSHGDRVSAAMLILLANIVVVNLSESRLLLPNSIFTTMLAIFAFAPPLPAPARPIREVRA